jgi:hypothetical protein
MPLKRRERKRLPVLFVDLALSASVISAVLATLLPNAGTVILKARFTEPLLAMANERAALVEEHAHSGVWAAGAVRGGTLSGRQFTASMRPDAADRASDWSVRWRCGTDLPGELAPAVCREAKR